MTFPKIIHLIYIPWDTNQRLCKNYMDFDTKFYYRFKSEHKEWEVKMWTWDKIETFMNHNYQQEWILVKSNVSRPTQLVDYLRWKLVYHHGGIYWQYGSLLKGSIEELIPKSDKGILLLTESIQSFPTRLWKATNMIMFGTLDLRVQVANQVFSSYPKSDFIQLIIDRYLYNIQKYKVKRDFDILFIGANHMVSKIYDEVKTKTNEYKVDLLSLEESKNIVEFSSKGSWRQDSISFWDWIIIAVIIFLSIFAIFISLIIKMMF